MPDYFFHIAVELFTDFPPASTDPTNALPPNLSQFFHALKPFPLSATGRHSQKQWLGQKNHHRGALDRVQSSSDGIKPKIHLPHSDSKDHRLDTVVIEGADMASQSGGVQPDNIIEKGIGSAISGRHMKGRYEPIHDYGGAEGWGIVHLYRDSEESPGLYQDSIYRSSDLWSDSTRSRSLDKVKPSPKDEECTTLCILAVPSYMTPSDLLSFVGEETRSEVSHFRMVRTSRANRYMVLMKFKSGKKAREWQREWNGKIFNTMEPETCHVVFLKSVELIHTSAVQQQNSGLSSPTTSYPRMSNDPFISPSASAKPLAPRTSSLVELPTCPVCLERMDETTGLLTIPCQHVFHCTCLEKWSGGGCPVCRYTHDDFSSRISSYKHKSKIPGEYEVEDNPRECEVCHVDTSLWQCLICAKVGCGRYEGKHAYLHFEETGHAFSIDLESKRVWDYVGDGYVHRIIQDAANPHEKLVELPGRRREPTALEGQEDIDMAKMDNMALEYTHLLTSQLESQRVYFEEVVERAVDKAAEASKKAERAMEEGKAATQKLHNLEMQHDLVAKGRVPELEKELARLEKRSLKFEEMSRIMTTKYQEEKTLSSSLMQRVKFLEGDQLQGLKETIRRLEEENATKDLLMEGLQEEHRDAMMQISAQRKLQEMVDNGELEQEDLDGAIIEAGPARKLPVRKTKRGQQASHGPTQVAAPSTPQGQNATGSLLDHLWRDTFSQSQRSKEWDEDKAKAMFEELRAKLIDHGMLSISHHDGATAQVDGSEVDTDEVERSNDGETKAKVASKKRKGKNKKKN
ncbi:hypothetical protein B0A52_07231 [Exophiala mesophila]|uniref:Uncharacterized protein n=1 Tax=Exophiala mesophila TaxID=212818 RepID=A0A438N0K4_EXOME|nr:hypothetical protein B0A52_07231 [Exophiala mesophila]